MPVFFRCLAGLLAGSSALSASGCCSLAAFFCGPDRTRWVAPDYREPDRALATFLEAVRRDRPDVVYESLSEQAKVRYGVPGVMETTLAWERLKQEVSGLHLLGTATVTTLGPQPDGRVSFQLSVAGRSATAWVVEQPFWEVWWLGADGYDRAGRFVRRSDLAEMLVVQTEDEAVLDARVRDPKVMLPDLRKDQVRELRVGIMWKVDELSGLTDP